MKKTVLAVVVLAGLYMPQFATTQNSDTKCSKEDLERLQRAEMPADVREMMDSLDARIKKSKEDRVVVIENLLDIPKGKDPSK